MWLVVAGHLPLFLQVAFTHTPLFITNTQDPVEMVTLTHTATCLGATFILTVIVAALAFSRPAVSFTLSPQHARLPVLRYIAEYVHHLYAAFPSCVFKVKHWRNGANLDWAVLDEAVTDAVCVVTGVRTEGGIGFETCLALLRSGKVCRVYAGVHTDDDKVLLQVYQEMQRRLRMQHGMTLAESQFIPLQMDLTDFQTSYASASTLKAALTANEDYAIHYFIGTIGMGFDRPTKGEEAFKCRYTENDNGVEFQTGVNAVGTLVLILVLLRWFGVDLTAAGTQSVVASPALSTGSFESTVKVTEFSSTSEPARPPTRIILTSSVAHFWSTLPPFTVKPRYDSWDVLRKDGQSRTNAGRYSFSKVSVRRASTCAIRDVGR